VELSSRGALLTRALLRDYSGEDTESPLVLISAELLSTGALALELDRSGTPLDEVVWEVAGESSEEQSVAFRAPLGGDRAVEKRIRLARDDYLLEVEVIFTGDWPVARSPQYRLSTPDRIRYERTSRGGANRQVTGYAGPDGRFAATERRKIELIPEGERLDAQPALWSGLESNYFAFVMRPVVDTSWSPGLWNVVVRGTSDPQAKELAGDFNEQGIQGLPYSVGFRREARGGETQRFEVFLGPKDRQVLSRHAEVGYGELIDYGRLGFLVRIFLWLLSFFEGIFRSYGIAIICLTVIVKAALHPINKKNQAVMQQQQKKMAKIQPEMQKVKERYKNDSMKANREIQKLMKEQGVNPAQMFGGCLMIFLQLPVWIGLINTFSLALELRQTPFLYISDLTQPDHLFELPFSLPLLGSWFNLLPVVYVILTLVNQRMMPKSDNPQMQQQQKMMTFMMVAFGFIFYGFSSGLLLYFLTSAGLGIIEQKIIRAELRGKGIR
ncbi:MAG: YidC/Oxa1 family insertase periplasmic-domain containing protein, partial [Planctomycetota bacterium]